MMKEKEILKLIIQENYKTSLVEQIQQTRLINFIKIFQSLTKKLKMINFREFSN